MSDIVFFRAGVITGVHGLKGDLKVRPHSGDPDALLATHRVRVIRVGAPPVEHTVVASRWHKDRVLLRLEGLEHIQQVEHLVGAEVESPIEELPELAAGDYYWYQLEGLRVVDRARGELGTLTRYYTTAAHDTYVVEGPAGTVEIPAVDAFIVAVDLEGRTLQVDLPDGLVDLG